VLGGLATAWMPTLHPSAGTWFLTWLHNGWHQRGFSAVLPGRAFYFFSLFTNVAARRAWFVIVRLYVVSVILTVVAYETPFSPPTSSDGSACLWPRIVGLYKLSGQSAGKDPATAAALLGLFV